MLNRSHIAADETGITMIELVVAMLLSGVAMAIGMGLLMTMMQSSQKGEATRQAETRAGRVLDEFATDLRQAQSPERGVAEISSMEALRDSILRGRFVGGDQRDIRVARPNELWFVSNVTPEPAGVATRSECVGYYMLNQQLVREVVADWRRCGRGNGRAEVVLPRIPDAQVPANVFSYDTLNNVRPNADPLDPDDCVRRIRRTSVTGTEMNWITTVRIDLRSYSMKSQAFGETKLTSAVDLRTRLSNDYLYALGCAF